MRATALKQTPRDVATPRQISLFYRPGGVASPPSCPFIAPFQRSPLSSPFSRSRPVCLFLLADGCPYFSLYPLRSRSPSRLDPSLSPFFPPFSLYPALRISFSRLLPLFLFSLSSSSASARFTSFGYSCSIFS